MPPRLSIGLFVIGSIFLPVSTVLAACDPSGAQACEAWAVQQTAKLGCHVTQPSFNNAVDDLYLNQGCRLQGTSWTDANGKTVTGGFSNGVNVDSAGCIARYTPSSYLKQGGYFRTPTETIDGQLRNQSLSGCTYDSDLGKKDSSELMAPIMEAIKSCVCAHQPVGTPPKNSTPPQQTGGTTPAAAPIVTDQQTPSGECPGDHRVKRGHYCGCVYGYEIDTNVGGCHFITEGLGLTPSDAEKIGDAADKIATAPDGVQTVEITVKGKAVRVVITGDPTDMNAYLYTIDGIHFSNSLSGALNRSFGNVLVDDVRTVLTDLSPFNWFDASYKGDDKDLKFNIGRALAYDDIDQHRSNLVGSLKYMTDFQSGLAAYIDLREQGKSASAILANDQDIDADIERFTARLRVAVQGKKTGLSDADKAKLDAAQKQELYAAYEDGFVRYRAAKAL